MQQQRLEEILNKVFRDGSTNLIPYLHPEVIIRLLQLLQELQELPRIHKYLKNRHPVISEPDAK